MNYEQEQKLEAQIARELKALPELAAPPTLIARVLAAIELRAALPWFRRSWQTWPAALQASSLLVLLAVFGGLCFAGWEVSQIGSAVAAQKLGGIFSAASAIWNALNALAGAMVLVVHKLGTGFLIGCGVAIAFAYAMFVLLGAAYFRLAFARR